MKCSLDISGILTWYTTEQMSIRDPDFRHNYAATGVDPGIISNRIGNTFNLKGPR